MIALNNEQTQKTPVSADDSWRNFLGQNVGKNVIISFLIGTQNTVVVEGKLTYVGNDYLVIYQTQKQDYLTADFYCIKFVEFKD